jgi:hypothetical protein
MLIPDQETNCPVHGDLLHEDNVLIRYGLIRYQDDYLSARNSLFPNSKFFILGGCVRRDEIWHKVMYCPVCREQHLAWCTANHREEGLPPSKAEVEAAIQYQLGNPNFSGTISVEAEMYLSTGKMLDAVKALKRDNPDIEVSELKQYVLYRQRKAAHESVIAQCHSA